MRDERFTQKTSDLLPKMRDWLIYHERPEQIAQGRSFDMSDLSNWLTVTHLSWAIWANHSQSLIWSERSEQMGEWAMSKWANSQPCLLAVTCLDTHTILEFATKRQHKAVCVVPLPLSAVRCSRYRNVGINLDFFMSLAGKVGVKEIGLFNLVTNAKILNYSSGFLFLHT